MNHKSVRYLVDMNIFPPKQLLSIICSNLIAEATTPTIDGGSKFY